VASILLGVVECGDVATLELILLCLLEKFENLSIEVRDSVGRTAEGEAVVGTAAGVGTTLERSTWTGTWS